MVDSSYKHMQGLKTVAIDTKLPTQSKEVWLVGEVMRS